MGSSTSKEVLERLENDTQNQQSLLWGCVKMVKGIDSQTTLLSNRVKDLVDKIEHLQKLTPEAMKSLRLRHNKEILDTINQICGTIQEEMQGILQLLQSTKRGKKEETLDWNWVQFEDPSDKQAAKEMEILVIIFGQVKQLQILLSTHKLAGEQKADWTLEEVNAILNDVCAHVVYIWNAVKSIAPKIADLDNAHPSSRFFMQMIDNSIENIEFLLSDGKDADDWETGWKEEIVPISLVKDLVSGLAKKESQQQQSFEFILASRKYVNDVALADLTSLAQKLVQKGKRVKITREVPTSSGNSKQPINHSFSYRVEVK